MTAPHPPTPAGLAAALADGLALLQELARAPERAADLLGAYRARHAPLRATLLEDRPPGSPRAEHDLHLDAAGLGGVTLAWRVQDGSPWALHYADHWAAQYVVSVNERVVTIRQALATLRLAAQGTTDLLTDLVDHELIQAAVAELDPPVERAEALAEVERLRRTLGLERRARLLEWLAVAGLTEADLVEMGRDRVRRTRWEEALAGPEIDARFARAPDRFARVTLVEVIARTEADARACAAAVARARPWSAALEDLPPGARATVRSGFAFEADPGADSAGTPAAARVVVERRAAVLDEATRAVIRQDVVRAWLDERRRAARIRWFWP